MHTTYQAGQWYVLVLPGAVVAVPPEVPADVVAGLWEQQTPGRTTIASVAEILSAHAGGLASVPPFAVALAEGADIRLALRGEVAARVSSESAPHEFTGAQMTTWSERLVSGVSRVELTLEETHGPATLPVQSGVVRAAAVSAVFESRGEPAEQPQPAAPPEPAEPAGPRPAEQPAELPPVEEPAAQAPPALEATLMPSEVTLAPAAEDFDQMWGDTVLSAPASPPPGPAAQPTAEHGDHDGSTVSLAELRRLREQVPLATEATSVATPEGTGRIRVSTGQVVPLDRTVIVGRRPRSPRASGASLPHLVAVDSPRQDISRSHLEIRPEGDTVVVIDLHTTNGSTLLRPGADPVRLHPGEQTLVLTGDVVDLGDGVEVTFEDLP